MCHNEEATCPHSANDASRPSMLIMLALLPPPPLALLLLATTRPLFREGVRSRQVVSSAPGSGARVLRRLTSSASTGPAHRLPQSGQLGGDDCRDGPRFYGCKEEREATTWVLK